jgi:hypothetical protein
LVPALAMRLWAEERKSGSIELLMTLPLETWHAVAGKFLAAWGYYNMNKKTIDKARDILNRRAMVNS